MGALGGFFGLGTRTAPEGDEQKESLFEPIRSSDYKRRIQLLDSFEDAGLGWFWATDAQGRLIYLSRRAIESLGLGEGDIYGKKLTEIFVPCRDTRDDKAEKQDRPLTFYLAARNSISRLHVKLAGIEKEIWWEIVGKPQFNERKEFTGYRGSAKDVTVSRETQIDAERLSQYDSLTGLSNRHRMKKELNAKLNAYRASKRVCALMMLDLDRFKNVNDTLGHPAGDELLKQVAGRLNSLLEDKGEIGRLGGDEFQIILSDIDDRGELGEIAARVIQMLAQPYSINGYRAIIGVSLGIAVAPYDGIETDDLVKAADLALYAAKGGGRGRYRFYSSELNEGAKFRRLLEEDLRDAMHREELTMHYQPIVRSDTYKVAAFEALIRWEHPERGFVSPEEFIAVAEDLGIINKIGEWALHQACMQAAEWPVGLRVAINVSATQFVQEDFVDQVKSALQTSRLSPDRLELEITESVFIGDAELTQKTFLELKELGIRLALDDFGTGYSSLSYLQHAPFDKIKIDQSFVRGATEAGNNNAAILSAIVGLADALDMETVCEGVETKDELKLVTKRGATHIQGYLFSRPIPHKDAIDRLTKGDLKYEPRGPERSRAERKTVFRTIGAIHDDHRYQVVLRNISKTGARIEGLLDVPVGTEFVLDLGEGQLAVAIVRRSSKHTQGVEFENPLISDGADGFCTRHRVSPYAIEAAGRPLAALPKDAYGMLIGDGGGRSIPAFAEAKVVHP